MLDIDQLTNEEIREQLVTRGCDPGPVIGSTRNVYANKLKRLLEEESKSNVVVHSTSATADATGNDIIKSSPKRRDSSHSPQKSRSPRRTTRSSAQEVTGLPKVRNTPLSPKLSHASPRTVDVSVAKSQAVSNSKKSTPKPSVHTSPKPRVNAGPKTFSATLPQYNSSPSTPNVNSNSTSLHATSSSFKLSNPYPFEKAAEVYNTTPTTRFTSLRNDWKDGRTSDDSNDDLRGEESSRILLPSWKEDHAYSAGYDSKQNSMGRYSSDENSTVHYKHASRYNSGAMLGNFYNGQANQRFGSVDKVKESKNYGKIAFYLAFIITAIIFIFFVVQNYAELEIGDGNKEEF